MKHKNTRFKADKRLVNENAKIEKNGLQVIKTENHGTNEPEHDLNFP